MYEKATEELIKEREFRQMKRAIKDSGIIGGYDAFLDDLRTKGLPSLVTGGFNDGGNSGAAGDIFDYAAIHL